MTTPTHDAKTTKDREAAADAVAFDMGFNVGFYHPTAACAIQPKDYGVENEDVQVGRAHGRRQALQGMLLQREGGA